MDPVSRRRMLAASIAAGAMTAGQGALAQAGAVPQPREGGKGGTDPGPRNIELDRQNPDILTPPLTDNGTLPNLKWSFGLSHMRLQPGGWARQTTVRELPVSTTIAGVNMRLNPGAIRELHWHKAAEWGIMLNGRARVTCIDPQGRSFIDDVAVGDLWYFPGGYPHSIQGLAEGCEFLLAFDDGDFSEDNTFSIADWFAHTPRSVLAKNFQVPEDAFAKIPPRELYIFEAPVPPPLARQPVDPPNGAPPEPFVHRLMQQQPTRASGGTVRIADSGNFKVARTIAAALVEVEPGGMRELHWHPNAAEWQYYIEGQGRMTVFGATAFARTFDYQAGDVGYVPLAMGHYIENTGTTTLRFLEMFRSPHYADLSLDQWMALLPPALVKQHLHLDDATIAKLRTRKDPVVG